MGRVQKNDNFIDKTFTIVADILLKVFPASKQEKEAFFYYRDGMSAQSASIKATTAVSLSVKLEGNRYIFEKFPTPDLHD